MPDVNPTPGDWQTFIQWLAGISVVIGGIIAGWFGTKKSKQSSPEDHRIREHDEEIERLRISEAERIKAISDLSDERIRRDFGAINDATRQSVRDEISRLENMINRNQNDISVLKVVVGLKSKHED